jgi:hypothetical protein
MLGEVGLLLVLEESFDVPQARAAADEWGGDSYVAWQVGTRVCVRDTIVTRGSKSALTAALSLWAKQHPHATVTGTGPFTITSCAG